MIILTGAAGFIGSCIVKELNNREMYDIAIVDEKDVTTKKANLKSLKYTEI